MQIFCVCSQQRPSSPSALSLATNFVAIGYNLLRGNPEGGFRNGGTDPGLRVSYRVLNITYNENRRIFYNGQTHSLPDQVNFQPVSSCSFHESSKAFIGTQSYQRKLSADVTSEGNYNYKLTLHRQIKSTSI